MSWPSSLAPPLLIMAIVLIGAGATTQVPFVRTAGSALRFDGGRAHRPYLTIRPTCTAHGNPFDTANVTLALWMRTRGTSPELEQTLLGYAYAQGPSLHLHGRDGYLWTRGAPSWPEASTTWRHPIDPKPGLADGLWHHVAVSTGPSHFYVFVDGRLQNGWDGPMQQVARADAFVAGVYDPGLASGNAMPFGGEIDDVRIYGRAFRDDDDLFATVVARPPTPSELQTDLMVALSFDDGIIVNDGFVPVAIELGGGLLGRSPLLVPSTAPIYSRRPEGPLLVDAVLDETTTFAPIVALDLFAVTPRWGDDRTTTPSPTFDFTVIDRLENVPLGGGLLRLAGADLTSGTTATGVTDPQLTFEARLDQTGASLVEVTIAFVIDAARQQNVKIVVGARLNGRPVAGGPGLAAQFDGVDDFYIADHLAWPTTTADINGETVTGLSPITIEFWSLTDPSGAGDTALFALGGNTEMTDAWVEAFNARRRSGRWHLTLPDETDHVRVSVGDDTYAYATATYYHAWTHYAFVHDGVAGSNARLYINGVLVSQWSPWHQGLQEGLLDFNHVTLGTWTFWSEVYHKGVVDDFRLWTLSRSSDDIRHDMYRQLTGDEDNLYAYWTFDGDADGVVVDRTGRGNDLRAGGCVPCQPRFYCQPLQNPPPVLGPDNCVPSAKNAASPHYRGQACYGGTVCFLGEERHETYPTLVASGAPIGGHTFDQESVGGQPVEFTLNGTDPDADPLVYVIEDVPERGLLQYRSANGAWVEIDTAPFALPDGLRDLRILSEVGDGGTPFAVVRYTVRDALAPSLPAEVRIDLRCPSGQYLDADASRCMPCPPGTFSDTEDVRTDCALCGLNEFQPNPGQTACLRCTPGATFTDAAGSAACWPCNASRVVTNPSRLAATASFCALTFATDNAVSVSGGLQTEIDFAALLPPDTAPDTARVVLSTVPQYGRLRQLPVDGDDDADADFRDYFYASVSIGEQYAVRVVDVTSELGDRPANATLGAPDVMRSGSSARAWAASDTDSVVANLTLQFPDPVYVTGVVVFENIGGGAVTQLEARTPDGTFAVIWSGDALPDGLGTARQFAPSICPTPFRTDILRLTLNTVRCRGRNEIDAVRLLGATDLRKSRRLLVRDPRLRVAYTPPTLASLPGAVSLGYRYTDTISYEIQSCYGGEMIAAGVQTLTGTLGAQHVVEERPSPASTTAAVVLAALGLATCAVSAGLIVYLRREPILRASSIFFTNVMLLGLGLGFVVLLGSALDAQRPLPGFCMGRAFAFSIAFDLLIASIIVKTARIVIIFELTKGSRVVRVTNARLFVVVVVMVGVDLVLLGAASLRDPLRRTLLERLETRTVVCASGPTGALLVTASTAYKGVLALLALALAVKGRHVPSAFNEVRSLSFMAYTMATNSIIYVIVTEAVAGSAGPTAALLVLTFTLGVALFSIWAILIAAKLYIVRFRPEQNSVDTGVAGARPGSRPSHQKSSRGGRPTTTPISAVAASRLPSTKVVSTAGKKGNVEPAEAVSGNRD